MTFSSTYKAPVFAMLTALVVGYEIAEVTCHADAPIVPADGYSASHYGSLWARSPFAVATSEVPVDSDPGYALVGVAHLDGVDYANVIETKSQRHFLVFSGGTTCGLSLVSISRGDRPSDASAVLKKDGELIQVKMADAPVVTAPVAMVQSSLPQRQNYIATRPSSRVRIADPERYILP
jgi:hypothetical protein